MFVLVTAGVPGCASLRRAPMAAGPDLLYEVTLLEDGAAGITGEISMQVKGAAEGVTTFTLAEGRDHGDVERNFAGLVASTPDGQALAVARRPGRPQWVVQHRPGQRLSLHWRQTQALPRCEDRAGRHFRVAAASGLPYPYPPHLGEEAQRIGFRWRGFAETAGWATASSFGLERDVTFAATRWQFLHTHSLAAPHMTFTRRQLDPDRALVLAVVGQQWKFSRDALADDAIRIVRGVRALFAHPGPPLPGSGRGSLGVCRSTRRSSDARAGSASTAWRRPSGPRPPPRWR